jgi:hypothetical protein
MYGNKNINLLLYVYVYVYIYKCQSFKILNSRKIKLSKFTRFKT